MQKKILKAWQEVRIRDYFEVTNGKTNTDDAVIDGRYPLFDRSVEVKLSNKYLFDIEAVIVPGEGKEFVPQYYSGKFDLHQRAYAIFSKSNAQMSVKYLYYWIDSNRKYLSTMAVGSTVKSLRLYMLKNFPLSLPSYIEQQKIAEILSLVDKEIQKTDQVIQKTEQLKQGLMQHLFTRGIGHTKFKRTRIGSMPQDWIVSTINDCTQHVGSGSTPRGGSSVYLKEGIPLIRSQNVHFRQLILDDVVYISGETHILMKRSKVLPNDVLLNITGASIGRVCVAPEFLVEANVNQHVCIIRTNTQLLPKFLAYLFESDWGQEQINKFQAGGNRQGLNFQQIRSIEIPLPGSTEQRIIANTLFSVDEKLALSNEIKQKLIIQKKALMQDLLSGKVRVN